MEFNSGFKGFNWTNLTFNRQVFRQISTKMMQCLLCGTNWNYVYYSDVILSSKNRPWLRRLIADLSLRRPRFDPESIHEIFLANWHRDKALLRVPWFSPGITIPPLLYTYLDLKTTFIRRNGRIVKIFTKFQSELYNIIWFFFIIVDMVVCFVIFLLNSVSYVFLLLCMICSVYSVFIVPTAILRLSWLRFFRAFSSVVR